MKSHTIYASGPCNGQDIVGGADYGWENQPITIVGAEINVISGGGAQLQYAFAGNSYTPDVMVMIGQGMSRGVNFFPPSVGMPFPAAHTPQPARTGLTAFRPHRLSLFLRGAVHVPGV